MTTEIDVGGKLTVASSITASTKPVDKAAQQTRRVPGQNGRAPGPAALSPWGQGGPRRLAGMAKQGVEGGRSSQRMRARVSPAAGRSREAGTAGRKKGGNKSRGAVAQHCGPVRGTRGQARLAAYGTASESDGALEAAADVEE
jgi:hypothetical protein